MDERAVQNILIEILYATVNELENNESIKEKITPDVLPALYRLAKKQDLAHVVSNFIYQNKVTVEPKLQARLQQEEMVSVYRYEQMKFSYEEICAAFDVANIVYIPLKGAVIRPYYPYESMRTSCDIDILIHEKDLETAITSLKNKGYRFEKRNYHDVSLYAPNNIHLELHFNIQENMDNLDAILKNAWDYALPINGTQYSFSKEFFAFHIYAHMVYHFASSGCGIRPLLDIWVMEHKMGTSHSCAKQLLEQAGIYKFATEMSRLADLCFTQNTRDDFYNSILKYIFQGGVYGSKENHIAVDKYKSKGSAGYAVKRLFMPYKSMVIAFPFLKKAPYLLPFCWVARCIKAVLSGKSKRIVSEMVCANNISEEKLEEVAAIYSRLGLPTK